MAGVSFSLPPAGPRRRPRPHNSVRKIEEITDVAFLGAVSSEREGEKNEGDAEVANSGSLAIFGTERESEKEGGKKVEYVKVLKQSGEEEGNGEGGKGKTRFQMGDFRVGEEASARIERLVVRRRRLGRGNDDELFRRELEACAEDENVSKDAEGFGEAMLTAMGWDGRITEPTLQDGRPGRLGLGAKLEVGGRVKREGLSDYAMRVLNRERKTDNDNRARGETGGQRVKNIRRSTEMDEKRVERKESSNEETGKGARESYSKELRTAGGELARLDSADMETGQRYQRQSMHFREREHSAKSRDFTRQGRYRRRDRGIAGTPNGERLRARHIPYDGSAHGERYAGRRRNRSPGDRREHRRRRKIEDDRGYRHDHSRFRK